MNLVSSSTSIAAYRTLRLAEEQRRVSKWAWKKGARGTTQVEAETALASRHAQKRFAELEDAWFIRKTGRTRVNPASNKRQHVYIGTPNVRKALGNPECAPLFEAAIALQCRVSTLYSELRAALKQRDRARDAVYAGVAALYGPERPAGGRTRKRP
jgi:hypothetical protein